MTAVTSVVVPAFNEDQRIGPTLERLLAYFEGRGAPAEIVVVDDGSPTRPRRSAARFAGAGVRLVRLPENRGKGAALRAGVRRPRAARCWSRDADLSTPIEELERLEAALADAELVLGSRAVGRRAHHAAPALAPRARWAGASTALIRLLGVPRCATPSAASSCCDGEVARATLRRADGRPLRLRRRAGLAGAAARLPGGRGRRGLARLARLEGPPGARRRLAC